MKTRSTSLLDAVLCIVLTAAPFSAISVNALQPLNDGGTPRGDCSGLPATTEVKLDWRGQNLAGCKVELLATRSRIHVVRSDCMGVGYYDLPPAIPRQWNLLSQPIGADTFIDPNGNTATLTLTVPGNYTVQLIICPSGNCPFFPLQGSTNFIPLNTSTGIITIRAEAELPLRAQERPVLPPSAMAVTPNLNLSGPERLCKCAGGGGYIYPQWVPVNGWSGANDYELLEGTVTRAWPSVHDGIFNHSLAWSGGNFQVVHDVNVIVSPDPQYNKLVSTKPEFESNPHLLGCEVQNDQIPDRLRPVEGDRVSLWGVWILDCGHSPFYTEIHPIVGWAVHKYLPVRIPDSETFAFDLVTNTVISTAGNNLYVPGVISDVWFNSDTGGNINGHLSSLHQSSSPSLLCLPNPLPILQSPIAREYDFNIYLPKNPSQVFAEVGLTRPRTPLYVKISNPQNSPGPDPVITRVTENVNGVVYEYLRVHLDLGGHAASTYSRRIEAAWVYPATDNWGLEQWRVSLDKLDVYDDLDSKLRWPGSDGDWVLWMMLPSADQSWTRILDGFNNTHGTKTFAPPWQTGSLDPVFQHPPLSFDSGRRLGPDVLAYHGFTKLWMGGYEADEGDDDGDPGRIANFVLPGTGSWTNTWQSHNDVFAATIRGQRIATLNNGTLSSAASAQGRHYLIVCTNKINNRFPVRDVIAPLSQNGLLVEGISGEPPWTPIDPQQLYGGSAALLGDVNGDNFPDMVLGTRGSNVEAHVFLGGRNGFPPAPHAIASVPLPAATGLSQGTQRTRTFVGASDANGDGLPDLLIGTPTYMNGQTNEGAVYLFSGAQLRAGGTFGVSNAMWSIEGNVPNAQLGYSLASGDINHDGLSDIVVGAPFYPNSMIFARPLGRVFVYLGSFTGISATPHQILIPELILGSQHWFGYSVSMAGDVNRDGYTDVIIGAPRYTRPESNEGAFYLFYGSSTGLVLNTSLLLEGNVLNAQFGYAVAGAGDVDGDGYYDVLVSAPFYSGSELTLENGYVALFRGSSGGLIPGAAWQKFGATGGAHFGSDLGAIGDINGDGRADVAIGTPDETGPDGLRGRVSYFLGASAGALSGAETWNSWGVSAVGKLMINSPCCVPFISACCNTGSTNKVDFNLDGFADVLAFDAGNVGEPFRRVQLTLGRGQRQIVLNNERYYSAVGKEAYALQSVFHSNFVANVMASGQTNQALVAQVLSELRDLYDLTQERGGDLGQLLPMLQRFQQVVPSNLFNQHFAGVDLEPGTAFYIDCGATSEYQDVLGRRWLPDAPFLVTTSAAIASLVGTNINDSLLGDRYLPNTMLNSERWFTADIRYQVGVPNGWYTVLLYFSEIYAPGVSPALGGTGCAACARLFDLEVEGQRTNAYNQADAALPPYGDGQGAIYKATQVAFNVQVNDGLMDIAVIDRGAGNPPENAAIKGIAILGRPLPPKFATQPRIARTTRDAGQFGVLVDPQASLARYLAGEIPMRLQSSLNLTQWTTLPNLPEVAADGAFFWLPVPTNSPSFYRAVINLP